MSRSRSEAPGSSAPDPAEGTLRPADHADSAAPAASDDIVRPALGPVGWLRWGWRQLTSMRTALVLLLLLAIAAVPGSIVPQRSADPITRVMGVIVILLGLVFIGLFGFAQRSFKPQVRGNLGLIGAPLLGLALGIGWAPCIGPTLGAILAMSWNFGDPVRAGLLGLAYSLGLGIPFILITLGFGWATRSFGFLRRHIRAVNIIGGVMLVILGVLMVSGVWTALMAQLQGVFLSVPLPL